MALFKKFDETTIWRESDILSFIESFDPAVVQDGKPKIYKLRAPEKIKRFFFRLISGKRIWDPPKNKIPLNNIKNALLFRYDAIGDYIVTTPILRWLKQANPDINIDVITSFRNDSLIKQDPHIRKTYPIHPGKNFIFGWNKAIKAASKENYDVIFALVFTYMSKCAFFAQRIAAGSEKITIMHKDRKEIYGLVFPRQTMHFSWKEAYVETMIRAAKENIEAGDFTSNPYIFFGRKEYDEIKPILEKENLRYSVDAENIYLQDISPEEIRKEGNPYCIMNISAYTENRRQSPEKAAEAAKIVLERYPELKLFISSAPKDDALADETVKLTGHQNCRKLKIGLNAYIAFIAGASFIISPDTAPVHIAAAAKVPVIGLYAELIKTVEWRPFNTEYAIVLSSDPETINAIEPVKIGEAVDLLVKEGKIQII